MSTSGMKSPSGNKQSNRGQRSDDKNSGKASISKKKTIAEDAKNGTPEVFTGWNNTADF